MKKFIISKVYILLILFSIVCSKPVAGQCGFSANEGCSNTDYNNSFVNSSSNAATIEYDNYTSSYHGTAVRQYDGTFKVWGQNMANAGTISTSGNALSPITLNGSNFPALGNAKVYKVTGGSAGTSAQQFVALASDGLYAWGWEGFLIDDTLTNGTSFQKVSVNGKADGLPPGVSPKDVKMMTGSVIRHTSSNPYRQGILCIVTCSGEVWVLSAHASMRGNGNSGNSTTWYKVQTNASGNPALSNIVAARVSAGTIMALDRDGDIWTWGAYTYLANNTAISTTRSRATKMTKPTGTPKMIGVTSANIEQTTTYRPTYYILMTDGNLYAMGDNSVRQIGDWTTTERREWQQPRYNSASGPVMDNILWISPNEHDGRYGSINVINANKNLYNWGYNDESMLGRGTTNGSVNPGIPNGLTTSSIVTSVHTGGHTTMITEQCQTNFGYVGHRINGSMGNGSNENMYESNFTFDTAYVTICASSIPTLTLQPENQKGTTGKFCIDYEYDLIASSPGGTILESTGPVMITGNPIVGYKVVFTNPGTATITYQTTADICPERTITETFQAEQCFCVKPGQSGTPDGYSNLGITVQDKQTSWPGSIPNGWIALESKSLGMVISRVTDETSVADPKEGMLIYDITAACVKLYNGTEWKCIERSCNN